MRVRASIVSVMSGLPRYLAAARIDDPEKIVWLADDLIGSDVSGPVVLLQVGRSSLAAVEAGRALQKLGRSSLSLVVRDRDTAKSEHTLARMAGACAVWVYADDMLETFIPVLDRPGVPFARQGTRGSTGIRRRRRGCVPWRLVAGDTGLS